MARLDAPWLAGFFMVLCLFLWAFSTMLPLRRFWLSYQMPQGSPLDMPAWYRAQWQYGVPYTPSGPIIVQNQWAFRKRLAVRGFW
jgi:hypothetical protein